MIEVIRSSRPDGDADVPEHLTHDNAQENLPVLLSELSRAFAAQRIGDGSHLMEETLKLDVSWESLTRAVWLGIEAGIDAKPDMNQA
jgi:hypothetical protein